MFLSQVTRIPHVDSEGCVLACICVGKSTRCVRAQPGRMRAAYEYARARAVCLHAQRDGMEETFENAHNSAAFGGPQRFMCVRRPRTLSVRSAIDVWGGIN